MWQYGMDVPVFEPGLTNTFGLGTINPSFTQPIVNTLGCVGCGTSTMGYTPFVTPLGFVKPDVNPFFGIKTEINPFFGLRPELNPFFGIRPNVNPFFTMGYTPFLWTNPYERLNTLKIDTLGINPWLVNPFSLKLQEEIWKSHLPYTLPIYNQPLTWVNPLASFGTPYGINFYNPFGFNGLDEKVKFGGLFGFQTTPFQTPIDWKLKSFTSPLGVTTDTWNKTIFPNVPWTARTIPGPVAVL